MIIHGIRNIHNFVNCNNGKNGNPAKKILHTLRNIRRFYSMLEFFRESQWQTKEWHQDYQRKKLHRIIRFTSKRVPFYSHLALEQGINSDGVDPFNTLRDFPIIKEADLRSNFNKFISDRTGNDDYIYMALSRRYSEKFYLPVDADTFLKDKAMLARHYENVGYRIGSPVLCFVNEIDGFEDEKFRHDKTNNRYYFSSNNLSRRNLADYCKKIKEINAGFIFGYPSSLEIFAENLLEWEISMKFHGIITSGEVLTDTARSKIESAFNAKVYDLYHYSFPVLGMGQCQYCEGYHLFSEYCVLELVDFNGKRITDKGKAGRLVVTNTSNHAFPLIRYDTGDLGIYDGNECDCGRGMPKIVRRVAGSQKELLISGDGKYILPEALLRLFSEVGYSANRYQLVQEQRNKFKLKLVRGPENNMGNLEELSSRLLKRLGANSDLTIEPVNRISGDVKKQKSIVRVYDPQ